MLADFWANYCLENPDHPVASDIHSGTVDPSYLVPLNLHGDGGRTYKKSELMVLQFQSCIGRGTNLSEKRGQKRRLGLDVEAAQVNLRGHSLSTRYLISVMVKKYYIEDASPLLALLGHVSDWFGDLYKEGLLIEEQRWRFLPIGLKGDLVFQAKAASLTRSFAHVRKRAPTKKSKALVGCCPWCLAGTPGVGFEDLSAAEPEWLCTSGDNNPMPWTALPSLLRSIPHAPDAASFLKIDLFHVLNLGVYKEFAASSLCLMLPLLAGSSNEENMNAMNRKLKAFVKENRLTFHAAKLTLDLIGAGTPNSYACGSWNKGQDSVVLMQFLPWLLDQLSAKDRPYKYISEGAKAIGKCLHTLYEEEAFMPLSAAREAAESGFRFLLCYAKLVEYSMQHARLLYNLTPKIHYFHHMVWCLRAAARDKQGLQRVYNPVCNSTSQCEDFIGNIARLSRRVSPKLPHSRVLRRYQAALADKMGLLD